MSQSNNTIVAFHIGRGGRFYNEGFLSFLGEKKISDFTNELFLVYENQAEVEKEIGDRENLKALFLKAIEDEDQKACDRLKAIGLELGGKEWMTCGGAPVGLTEEEAESGLGTINIDGGYDTTYTKLLSDLNEQERKLVIADDSNWMLTELAEIEDYTKEAIKEAKERGMWNDLFDAADSEEFLDSIED